jgi:hypothetical protein
MGTNEPLFPPAVNEPTPEKKKSTWIWIIVLVLALCLCLGLLAGGIGVYFYLNQSAEVTPPAILPQDEAPLPEPPTEEPLAPLPETVIVEPYMPLDGENYPFLANLAPGYEGSSVPDVNSWDVNVSSDQPVLIYYGWCAATADILEQNFQHIQFIWEVNGELLDMDSLYILDEATSDQECRAYVGIVWRWPLGEHVIRMTMHFDEVINDGWDDYPAGDYVDVFNITVTP